MNEQHVETLTAKFAEAVKDHYAGAASQDTVFEALNALALVSASVIAGTEGEALDWFLSALSQGIEDFNATTKRRALS